MSGFFRGHKRRGAFDLFSSYNSYMPGFGGMFMMLGLFLLGAILGAWILGLFAKIYGGDAVLEYGSLLSYPLMYIPAMLYATVQSRLYSHRNSAISMDCNNFGTYGGFKLSFAAAVMIMATAFIMEPVHLLLPETTPEYELQMKMAIEIPPVWVSFIATCIYAPFFEEWLCRGIILRGLAKRYHPAIAITVSAAFFGLIHANIWQGVPAFLIGLVLGYVYYKSGSLKLSMLMHMVNNVIALILLQIPQCKEADSMMDLMSPWGYAGAYIALTVAFVAALIVFHNLPKRQDILDIKASAKQ